MSHYFQSLTSYFHDKELLSDAIHAALLEYNNDFNSKLELNFGNTIGKYFLKLLSLIKNI
jgi:hypothetical protein